MTIEAPAARTTPSHELSCDRPSAVTRSLLGYGPLAGVVYVTSGVVQGVTRDGFDLSRHSLSLLANGPLGWIHVTTLVVAGLMTIAAAVGVHRALRQAGSWGGALLAGYGLALVLGGIFVADPMDGFPVGTPAGPPAEVSWHGMLHFVSGAIGFACLIAACFVLARRFAAERRRGWATSSRVTGVLFLAGFVGVAAGAGSTGTNLAFVAAVILAWAWVSALAAHLYRRAA
jgi:hypothetical membrane protein